MKLTTNQLTQTPENHESEDEIITLDFAQGEGETSINQSKYIVKILETFSMTDCESRDTPCEMIISCYNYQSEKDDPTDTGKL